MSTSRTRRQSTPWRTLPLAFCLVGGALTLGPLGCSSSNSPSATAPTLTVSPVSQTVTVGQAVTFSVTATGTSPFTYQWSKGGAAISGATGASYGISAAALSDTGNYTVTVSNSAGSVVSPAATLTVNSPNVTVAAPGNQTALDGATATFSVTATGTSPFTYQWSRGGQQIKGATAASYTTPTLVYGSDNGAQFTCTVTDSQGKSSTSAAGTLTVTPIAPVLVAGPSAATVTVGGNVTFSATATGTLPLSYQWNKGGVAIPGATLTSYAIPAAALTDAANYSVTVTNVANSITSPAVALTVNAVPVGVSAPSNQTATDGATATFSVTATGTAPYTYQWLKGGTAITGATSPSYTTPALVYASDNGAQFTCTVTDATSHSATSSAATLTVTPIAPAITVAPVAATTSTGTSVNFSVTATGTAPLSYQWFENGTQIAGATTATLTLPSPGAADNAAAITVKITNGAGQTLTSTAVTLTVSAPVGPAITIQPQSVTVRPPDGATFSVTATGSNLTYVWKKNGSVIAGATNSSYTVSATDLHNVADSYLVTVSNGSASTDSNAAVLTVKAPSPVYAGDPTSVGNANYYVVSSFLLTAPADPLLGSFRVGYDTAKMNPLWSVACFFPSQGFTFARPSTYPDDTRIPGCLTSNDYSNTGFSRGHQTGFADLRDTYGPDAGASSMYMSNMCPQDQTFNGGEWGNFETVCTQTYPVSLNTRVWVYTGPIFAEQIVAPIGAKNIPVPNAFYKVIVRETANGTPKVIAAIVPHSSTIGKPAQAMADTDFWKFTTTVKRVEDLTGLNFFPQPANALPATFKTLVDVTGWGGALEQGPGKPNVHMIVPSWDAEYKHINVNNNAVSIIDTTTGTVNTPIPFQGQATADPDAIVSTTWSFGDNSTDTKATTTHTYLNGGDYTVTFSATDAAGHTNNISRVITISGGASVPTITSIANVSTNDTTAASVHFTVAESGAQAANLVVTATSDTPAVLANNLTVVNSNGACTLVLTPIVGGVGTANVTVKVTDQAGLVATTTFTFTVSATPAHSITEGFESAGAVAKTSYGSAQANCDTGSWTLANALVTALSTSDRGDGAHCVRMGKYASGTTTAAIMNFDVTTGVQTVSVDYALYGSDSVPTWKLQSSVDQGQTWVDVGSPVTNTSATKATITFPVNLQVPAIRFQVIRADTLTSSRFDIDNIVIAGY